MPAGGGYHSYPDGLTGYQLCRFGAKLEAAHDEERLVKFEDLLEAAIDLDRIPDEYMICASYDANLEVRAPSRGQLMQRLMRGSKVAVNSPRPHHTTTTTHCIC